MPDSTLLPETRHCEVTSVLFQNAGGFVVARVRGAGPDRAPYVVAGVCEHAQSGQRWEVTGAVKTHPRYGAQFAASSIVAEIPTEQAALEKYLGSGVMSGVGPATARAVVGHFGNETFAVLEQSPDRVREIPGIGEKKAQRLIQGWEQARGTHRVMVFLREIGLGTALAGRVYRALGGKDDLVTRLRANPYLLATVRGIGFPTADRCALTTGIDSLAPMRLRAGLLHVLETRTLAGHTLTPETLWITEGVKALTVPADHLVGAAESLPETEIARTSIADVAYVALPRLARAERDIARLLRIFVSRQPTTAHSAALARVPGAKLGTSQRAALNRIAESALCVVTGGPGVGKTTLLKTIVAAWRHAGLRLTLCAPTGRAARRLTQATGEEAATIHRTLGITRDGRYEFHSRHPLETDAVIVDEASMIDTVLAAALLSAVPRHAAVVLVGDADQLPSVGPGAVLADIISSHTVPVARLTEIFRQAAGSGITLAAHDILQGRTPTENADLVFVPMLEDKTEMITALAEECIRAGFDAKEIQILAPMRRGPVGTEVLNGALRELWNPPREGQHEIKTAMGVWRAGDKVMQTRNNYTHDIYNGDIGYITAMGREDETDTITVQWEDRVTILGRDDLDDLVLAYAITTHKSQGGEYPVVITPVTTGHYPLLSTPVLYTAITRARERAILVGTKRAINIAVRQNNNRRVTGLIAALQEA